MSIVPQDYVPNYAPNYAYGIRTRDQLEDIFAYTSDRLENRFNNNHNKFADYVEYDDSSAYGTDLDADDQTRKVRVVTQNMLNHVQTLNNVQNMDPSDFQIVYAELLDTSNLIIIKNFRHATSNPWIMMKAGHIDPLEASHKCRLVDVSVRSMNGKKHTTISAVGLRSYTNYLSRIISHDIDIPDRFDVSNAAPHTMGDTYLPIKLIARYYGRCKSNQPNSSNPVINTTSIALMDLHSIRSKTLFCFHISKPSKRDGIIVSDQLSFSIYTALCTPNLASYISIYGVSSLSTYYTNNPHAAMICHMAYALLEPDLRRMVFSSVRQIVDFMKLLEEYDDVKKILCATAGVTDQDIENYVDSESTESADDDKTKHDKHASQARHAYHIERTVEVLDLLKELSKLKSKSKTKSNKPDLLKYAIKLWPKLSIVCCDITQTDKLRILKDPILNSLTKHRIILYSPVYAIPESIIGYNLECTERNTYILDPTQAYFEFIPIDINKRPKAKSFRRLQIGSLYELVVSSIHTDCVRQMTGVVVRVTSYYEAVPVLEPVCHVSEIIYAKNANAYNDDADDVDADDVDDADDNNGCRLITPPDIDDVFIKSELSIIDYCFRKDGMWYKFYVELLDYVKDKKTNKTDITTAAKKSGIKYGLARLIGSDKVEVRVVEPNTFQNIRNMRTIDAIDPYRIQVGRIIVSDAEITLLKNSIVYQF